MQEQPQVMTGLVAELPVLDVAKAQQYYRDTLGFEIAWTDGDEIGAVNRGDLPVFFRKSNPGFTPCVFWVYSPEVDDAYAEMQRLGANITEPIENKSWNHRQFTVTDLNGHVFYFHCDL